MFSMLSQLAQGIRHSRGDQHPLSRISKAMGNKEMTWIATIKSFTGFMQQSPSQVSQSLGRRVLRFFSFQFLFCNSTSKSEVVFITSVAGND